MIPEGAKKYVQADVDKFIYDFYFRGCKSAEFDPKVSVIKWTLKNGSKVEKMNRENELAYLAGVFDGEGSMGNWSRGKDKGSGFRLQIEMADADVLVRFLTYYLKGSITSRHRDEKHKNYVYVESKRRRR